MKADEAVTKNTKKESAAPEGGIAAAAVATAVFSSFMFGFQTIVLNSCAELIAVELRWCNNDWQSNCDTSSFYIGLANASVYLGASVGAYIMGRSSVFKLGSRIQILISDVLFAAGGIVAASAQNFLMLLVARLVSGLGLGLCAIAAPLYIAEISPRERRGVNSTMHGVGITVGILAGILLGLPQSPPPSGPGETLEGLNAWYWRFLLGIQLLPAIVQAILFYFVLPLDTPPLLVQRGQVHEARTLLYKTYGLDASTSQPGTPPQLLPSTPEKNGKDGKSGKPSTDANYIACNLELQLQQLVEAAAEAKDIPHVQIHQAFNDSYLRLSVLVGFGLAAFQQVSGINALMSYSNTFFREGGIPASKTILASTGMAMANVCVSFMSSRVVDHWGRRSLLLVGSLGQAFSMGILSICVVPSVASLMPTIVLGIVTVVAFSLFVVTFSAGLGAITWLYLSEIYPMEIRGSALSACGVINWLGSFGIVFLVKFLTLQQTCWLLFTISFVGFFGVHLWIVETKGCSMDDSPLTPRSGRSSSQILTPRSPKAPYNELVDKDYDVQEVMVQVKNAPKGA